MILGPKGRFQGDIFCSKPSILGPSCLSHSINQGTTTSTNGERPSHPNAISKIAASGTDHPAAKPHRYGWHKRNEIQKLAQSSEFPLCMSRWDMKTQSRAVQVSLPSSFCSLRSQLAAHLPTGRPSMDGSRSEHRHLSALPWSVQEAHQLLRHKFGLDYLTRIQSSSPIGPEYFVAFRKAMAIIFHRAKTGAAFSDQKLIQSMEYQENAE